MGFPYDTGDWSGIFAEGASGVMFTAVSYTHLTLPTILRV